MQSGVTLRVGYFRIPLNRFLWAVLLLAAPVPGFAQAATAPPKGSVAYFTNVAQKAGLTMMNVFGGKDTKKYIIETTGTGIAIFDYDNDG